MGKPPPRRSPRATLLLHGWEWLAGLLVLGIWLGFPWYLVAVLAGYGFHMVTDHMFNRRGLWSYFLVYRARRGFQLSKRASYWDLDHVYGGLQGEVPLAGRLIERWIGKSGIRGRGNLE